MTDQPDPLDKGLHDLAVEPVEPGHYARMMVAMRTNLERKSPMNNLFKNGALVSGLTIAVVLALVLIPATYRINVGTLVKAEFTLPDGVSPGDVASAASPLSEGRKMLMVDNGVVTLTLASKQTKTEALQSELLSTLKAKFPTIANIQISAEPIFEKHGGNALAAVTGGRIEIGCDGMTDAEIESAIVQALNAHGVNVQQVSVSTTSPGEGQVERRIEIRAEHDSSASCEDMPELELNIGDGGQGNENQQKRVIIRETR